MTKFEFQINDAKDALKMAEKIFWAGKHSKDNVEFRNRTGLTGLGFAGLKFQIIFHNEEDALHFKMRWVNA